MKKKSLASVAIGIFVASAGFAMPTVNYASSSPLFINTKDVSNFQTSNYMEPFEAHAGEATVEFTVYLEVQNEYESLDNVIAVGSENGEYKAYYGQRGVDGTYHTFTLAEGSYDFVAYGQQDNFSGAVILAKENVDVTDGQSITFNTIEAANRTYFHFLSESGEQLVVADANGVGNCITGRFSNIVTYKGKPVCGGAGELLTPATETYVTTNFTDSPFSLLRYQILFRENGVSYITLPVDFSKDEVSNTTSGWITYDIQFAETPIDKIARKIVSDYNDGAEISDMTTNFVILANGEWFERMSNSIYVLGQVKSGLINMWQPEEYDNKIRIAVFPTQTPLLDRKADTAGLPIVYGAQGAECLGINFACNEQFMNTAEKTSYNSELPYYKKLVPGTILGNSTPALIATPCGAYPQYGFIGMHGEVLTVDNCNLANYFAPEVLEEMGGSPNSVKVSFNGELLSDDMGNYQDLDWYQLGEYEVEIRTGNVLIDGTVPGVSCGTLRYVRSDSGYTLPTVTAFQVVDQNSGNVTNKIIKGEDSLIRIFAGNFKDNLNWDTFLRYNEVSEPTRV